MNNIIPPSQSILSNSSKAPQSIFKKVILAITIGIILIIVIGGVILYNIGMAPMQAGTEILANIKAGKIEQLYEDSSTRFKEVGTLEEFKGFIGKYKALQDIKEVHFIAADLEGKNVLVKFEVLDSEGKTSKISIELIEEGGKWLAYGIDVE